MAEGVTPLSGPSGLLGCVYLHCACTVQGPFPYTDLIRTRRRRVHRSAYLWLPGVPMGERAVACLLKHHFPDDMPYFEAILCKNREMSLSLFLPHSYFQAILSLGILINSILIRKKRCIWQQLYQNRLLTDFMNHHWYLGSIHLKNFSPIFRWYCIHSPLSEFFG